MLSKKDIVAINQQFHNGRLSNESSLDYAIEIQRRSRNWLRCAALLVRAILADHVFEDGNKRTAAAVIMFYLEADDFHYRPEKVAQAVVHLIKKKTTNTEVIERVIKNVIEE